jgi:hypothetical protein
MKNITVQNSRKLMRTRPVRAAAAACAVMAAMPLMAANFPNQIKWDTAVHDGYIDDLANWKNVAALPANGETQTFDLNGTSGDYTVRVRPGETVFQQAHFYVVNMPMGSTFTFDVTGAKYVQTNATYLSDWQAFGFYSYGTSHWCNFESVSASGGNPVTALEDAVLEAKRTDGDINIITLKRGTWNSYDPVPGGDLTGALQFMFGNNGDNAEAHFIDGSFFKANKITQRGGTIYFEGGSHEARGNVAIGNAYARNPIFKVTNGVFTAFQEVKVGDYAGQLSATFDVCEDGRFVALGSFHVVSSANAKNSAAYFRDRSESSIARAFVANATGIEAFMSVTNNATVALPGELRAGSANATGIVDVAGSALLSVTGALNVATIGANACGRVRARENGVIEAAGEVTIGSGYSGADGELRLSGNSRLSLTAYLTAKHGGRFILEDDAVIDAPSAAFSVDGTNGVIEFAGGTATIHAFNVYGTGGKEGVSTNVVRISGGRHLVTQNREANHVPMTIGNGSSHSLLEITGGELTVQRILRVGYGTTGTGSATLRMTGGRLAMLQEHNGSSAVVNVCDSGASVGLVEFLGGTISAQSLRGWTGSQAKGGSGRASLLADGGTLETMSVTSCIMQYFDDAVLGPRGLAVDTSARNATIDQAFTDAPGERGLFVKDGIGTLTVSRSSAHAETAVVGGTLLMGSQAATQFGRSLVVTNGATLSLAGSAASLTAESLSLGRDGSRGFLAFDSGDVVTLTGDDPLHVGQGFLGCDAIRGTVGAYDVFRFTGNVDADALAAELAKIRVQGALSDLTYGFSLVDVDGAKIARMSVAQRVATAAAWTGAESGDWSVPGNWQGGALPGVDADTSFPADAATRAVATAADAALYAMRIAGDYTFAGSGSYAPCIIDLASGATAAFSAPVVPSGAAAFAVGEGAALRIAAPISSANGSMSVAKEGSGLLALSAASPEWNGDWRFSGGTTRLEAPGALGAASDPTAVASFGPATLSFTNAPAEYTRSFCVDAGASKAAVLDVGSDTTLSGSFSANSGGLVKRGEAALTLNAVAGEHEIEADPVGGRVNGDPTGTVSFPASGDSPGVSGLGGLTVLEGVMRLQGRGAGSTVYKQTHHMLIGSTYPATVNAELEVANCTLRQGSAGYHLDLGGTAPAATAATHPTLRVIDGGEVSADGIKIANRGHASGSSLHVSAVMSATNATITASYAFQFGTPGDERVTAELRAGAGGVMRVTNSSGTGGLFWQGVVDAEIADGGWLGLTSVNNNGLFMQYYSRGEMRFLRGGALKVPKISSNLDAPTWNSTIVFDGGVLEFIASRESIVNGPDKRTIRLDGEGVEAVVGENISHVLEIPVNGEGAFAKSGKGELVLGVGRTLTASAAVTNDSGILTANWTGETRVKEGTLTIAAGAAREDLAVKVDDGGVLSISGSQTLGAVSGGGTVAGVVAEGESAPSLSCTISVPWGEESPEYPTFENIALDAVKVDFNAPAGETYKTGDRIAVARLGEGTTTNLRTWKTANAGGLVTAEFSLDGDVVYARMSVRGMYLFFK